MAAILASSIKLKRRVELKERKISKILKLKNHFGQFYKLNNDNSQLHTSYGLKITFKVMYNFIYGHGNYILVLYSCRDMPF